MIMPNPEIYVPSKPPCGAITWCIATLPIPKNVTPSICIGDHETGGQPGKRKHRSDPLQLSFVVLFAGQQGGHSNFTELCFTRKPIAKLSGLQLCVLHGTQFKWHAHGTLQLKFNITYLGTSVLAGSTVPDTRGGQYK